MLHVEFDSFLLLFSEISCFLGGWRGEVAADGVEHGDDELVDVSTVVGVDEVGDGVSKSGLVLLHEVGDKLSYGGVLHSGDGHGSGVGLESQFDGSVNSAEGVGGLGGVADLVGGGVAQLEPD